MAIYITGDIHGSNDIRKLGKRHFAAEGLTRDDYIIILGDFGLVWHDPPTGEERYWLDWLEDRPWTTLFVDGNHENHVMLKAFSVEEWNGGRVQRIREHVLHLMRGEVFTLDGYSFFCMGGAYSSDKEWRTPGKSWWEEEVPSEEERAHALESLGKAGWKVDFVLTHCPPPSALYQILGEQNHVLVEPDEYMDWLEDIAKKLDFTRWFYGHMHVDFPHLKPYSALYDEIVELLAGGETRLARPHKPLYIPAPEFSYGYTTNEIADYMECDSETVEQAIDEVMRGQTMGIHPETGEPLVYPNDVRQVLRYLERELG